MAKDETLDETLDEDRDEDGQIYVDRDKIDFDPDDGLLSGTAIDGTSDIPGSGDDSEGDDSQGDEPAANTEGSTGDKAEDNADEGEHDKDS